MNRTLAAALVTFAVLCNMTFAQDYTIQTDAEVNLRSWYSTDSLGVETVPAGTVLQVIGKFNRWLKISRNGSHVWLADWLDFTRIDSQPPQPSSQPSTSTQPQVDNCCFVDRQCARQAEWENGYYAFQNGQCQPPARSSSHSTMSQTRQSSQLVQINNLCFTVRVCRTEKEWIAGYIAFQQQNVASQAPGGETAVLARVIDGDTIDVRIGGRIVRLRYIGVDTPERGEACYSEATSYNRGLVSGKTLTLVRDVSETDRYGRLLRYVYADGVFVNLELVRAGYALAKYYAPDGKRANEFATAQQSAPQRGCVDSTSSQPQSQGQGIYVRNCTHARQLGIAPIYRGNPGYRSALDRDNDGIACE